MTTIEIFCLSRPEIVWHVRTASHQGPSFLQTTCAGGRGMIQGEPPLDELLSEPIVWLMAGSDDVSLDEAASLCEAIQEKLIEVSTSA